MSSKKEAKATTKTTTCLCGSISLTVTGTDKGAVLCHCSNCQKASGSSFAHNYRILNAQPTFHRGEDILKSYEDGDTKTGNVLIRHFCGTCGSPLFLKGTAVPGLVVLHTGGMQDRTQPGFELFVENKHEWVGEVAAQKPKM